MNVSESSGIGASTRLQPLQVLAALVIAIAGLKVFSAQIGPIALGFVLVLVISPIQGWCNRKGWNPIVGLLATMAVGYAILISLVLGLVWCAAELASLLTDDEYRDALGQREEQIADKLRDLGVEEGAVQDAISNIEPSSVLSGLGSALGSVIAVVSAVSLIVLVMFFMSGDASKFSARLRELGSTRPMFEDSMTNFAEKTRSYMFVSTAFGAIVAVLDGLALWLLGLPLVGVWVILSFITNYIPNVGFVIGVVPPALVALLLEGPETMIAVVVVYIVLNFIIQSLIQPRIVGDSVGLSTTLTFFSLVFWSFVIGPLGAILAVPLTLLAKALLVDADPGLQWMRPLISLDPNDGLPPGTLAKESESTTD